jgi:hypothetical protein
MGLYGLWCGQTLSLICISTVGVWIVLRTDWEQEVQTTQKRLEEDRVYQSKYREDNSGGEFAWGG